MTDSTNKTMTNAKLYKLLQIDKFSFVYTGLQVNWLVSLSRTEFSFVYL